MNRPIHTIAREIATNWNNIYFGAKPYLAAMLVLHDINDKYGLDDARSIITYFLANASSWRGAVARRIKSELKEMLKR